jgi:hypothetical protein
MQKRIQIVTNANTQIINEIVLMIFINTTSPTEAISYTPPTYSITFQKQLANFVDNPLDHGWSPFL